MDRYFEEKKRSGLIFTMHDVNPTCPYLAMDESVNYTQVFTDPGGVSWWSRLSCRYRTKDEQMAFIRSGYVDKKLPPRKETFDENKTSQERDDNELRQKKKVAYSLRFIARAS